VYLRRIALWLALLAAVLWLWPTSRLALFLLFQGGGRDSQLALFGFLVCLAALLLSVVGAVLTRTHELAAVVALGLASVVGALALVAVTLPLGSVPDLAAGAFALVALIRAEKEV
jgi:hypothetical protein